MTWVSAPGPSKDSGGSGGKQWRGGNIAPALQRQPSKSVEQQGALTYAVDVFAAAGRSCGSPQSCGTDTKQKSASHWQPTLADGPPRADDSARRQQQKQQQTGHSDGGSDPSGKQAADQASSSEQNLLLNRQPSSGCAGGGRDEECGGGGGGRDSSSMHQKEQQAWYRCREVQLAIAGYGSIVSYYDAMSTPTCCGAALPLY